MKLKGLVDEDVANYKKCAMYLIFPNCSFKCDKESGQSVCQNSALATAPIVEIPVEQICSRYTANSLTSAIVCGGLEPFDSKYDLIELVDCLRRKHECRDDIVIYTGYTEEELENSSNTEKALLFKNLKQYSNITVKFGRFVPDQEFHLDEILGVKLASPNQYAKKIS